MQDDFSLTKSLPLSLSELFKIMEEEKMDIVLYMRFTNKTDLDRDDNIYCKLSKSPKTYTFNNHKFTKLNLYSDNNHISTVDFYKNHVFPKCTNGSFMEFDVLCLAYEKDINFYAIGDLNDGNYIEHLDGKNTSNIKSLQNGGTIIDNNKKYIDEFSLKKQIGSSNMDDPVDVVITWGGEPLDPDNLSEDDLSGTNRYDQCLPYIIRSIYKYMNWIRYIIIFMDNPSKCPSFINETKLKNSKIKIFYKCKTKLSFNKLFCYFITNSSNSIFV